ncbi:MAG: YraN family protein [Clostridiales bacterium 43-6]|nr:MAG: YraN family protein [Clostridiales bacterium 43-6]
MRKHKNGVSGEIAAARYLRNRKYTILAGNYTTRFGEIDLIACDKKYIVFIEVKTRAQNTIMLPRETVDQYKQAKIIKSASLYLSQNKSELQPRFDVIEIETKSKFGFEITRFHHLENAFGLKGYL